MKKLFFTLAFIASIAFCNAQLVVSDPAVEGAMMQNIALSQQQLTKTEQMLSKQEEQLRTLKQMKEKVEQVNGALRNLQELKDIVKMQKESISIASKVRGRLNEFSSSQFRKNALNTLSYALQTLTDILVFIQKVTSNNFFSMTDKERMDVIKDYKTQAYRAYMQIRKYAN